MTEQQLRQSIIDHAKMYLDIKEGSYEHKKILETWNTYKDPYRRAYTMKVSDAWCMTFVWAMFIEAGCASIVVTDCGCGESVSRNDKYKHNWIENDDYIPKVGDIVMFDWQDDGKGDCTGWPEHTGICVSVSANKIKFIEGNSNDTVRYTEYPVNGRYIRGYIAPDFASIADKEDEHDLHVMPGCDTWLRKSPVNGEKIKVLKSGTGVDKLAENAWYYVSDGADSGWVSAKYMEDRHET